MSALIKDDSGNWKKMGVPLTRIGGTWRPAKQMWTKINNEWKKIFDLELNENFDGAGDLDGQSTPGNSIWKTYRGSWSKSGGLVTAGELNSVAGIETGTNQDISLEIDSSSTSQAGHGVAFWIQDQSNWWGAQTFYETFTFTNAPNSPFSITYNHSCQYITYTSTATQQFLGFNVYQVVTQNINPTGVNFSYGVRNCRANGTLSGYTALSTGCTDSCSPQSAPGAGSPCTSAVYVTNCGTSCTNCVGGGTSTGTFFSSTCPTPTSNTGGNLPNCTTTFSVNYSCSSVFGPSTCVHNVAFSSSPYATQSDISSSNLPNSPTTPPCSPATAVSCVSSPSSVFIPGTPGTTVTSTRRQTRLIRSQSGSVSTVSSTTSPDYGGAIGSLEVTLEPSSIKTRAYSGFNKSGTAYPTQTYSIPAGVAKGTKHGIVVSGTPSNQGYSISRFKATLT